MKTLIFCLLAFFSTGCMGLYAKRAQEIRQELDNERQAYVSAHPELGERVKRIILGGGVALGMTSDQAVASRGLPCQINRSAGEWGAHDQWIYGCRDRDDIFAPQAPIYYLYFAEGKLSGCQEFGSFGICPG